MRIVNPEDKAGRADLTSQLNAALAFKEPANEEHSLPPTYEDGVGDPDAGSYEALFDLDHLDPVTKDLALALPRDFKDIMVLPGQALTATNLGTFSIQLKPDARPRRNNY